MAARLVQPGGVAEPEPFWRLCHCCGSRPRRGHRRRACAARRPDRFKIRQSVFLAELALEPFYAGWGAARAARRYQPISRFPLVERDFSLTLDDGTLFAGVREAIEALGIAELASVEAVDLFHGKHLPAGKFSLLVRATFQSQQATLTEAQVNEFSTRILAALERQLGATLRTALTRQLDSGSLFFAGEQFPARFTDGNFWQGIGILFEVSRHFSLVKSDQAPRRPGKLLFANRDIFLALRSANVREPECRKPRIGGIGNRLGQQHQRSSPLMHIFHLWKTQ